MIKPTVGRVVHFYNANRTGNGAAPRAAIVAYVHSDQLVNLAVFNTGGDTVGKTSVRLIQPGEDVPDGEYCAWMPYQVDKAAKGDNNSESAEPRAE